jgi:transposase
MMVMTKRKIANRYSPEVRALAVRMVFEHQGSYETQAGAIAAIAPKIGCIPQTLREWVKQAEKDSGMRDGVTTEERDRIKTLERENRELRQANEILRKASAYFAQAELDRPLKRRSPPLKISVLSTASSRSAESCRSRRRHITSAWRAAPRLWKGRRGISVTQSYAPKLSGSGTKITRSTGSARHGISLSARALRWRAALWTA